jgi:hypothetical protein
MVAECWKAVSRQQGLIEVAILAAALTRTGVSCTRFMPVVLETYYH